MTSWTMAKGLLIHDALGVAITLGVLIAVLAGSFAAFCVNEWRDDRKRKRARKGTP